MTRVPLTPQGKIRMQEELTFLRNVERQRIVKEIEAARAHGDLSENAEFHAAKDRQGQIEGRIRHLEDLLGRADVVDPARLDTSKVVFGVTVSLVDVDSDKEVAYQIVGEPEANIEEGRLAVTAPLARALIGKEVGEEVEVRTPGGTRQYEITAIQTGGSVS